MSFRAVFRHPPFAVMWSARVLIQTATLTQSVAIGWLVYSAARQHHGQAQSMFYVGMIGLAQFTPMFLLALLAGDSADRYDRRKILVVCGVMQAACAAAFTFLSWHDQASLIPIFVVTGFFGVARAFMSPAFSALLSALVPLKILPKAIAWNTLGVQAGMIFGAWLGGALCAITPVLANGVACGCYIVATSISGILLLMPIAAKPRHNGLSRLAMIREGLMHLRDSKVVLGAISLDLFAVLLGGVTALLPAYARDILHTGPQGFGQLRSAFALGAGATTLVLAWMPVTRHAGKWILGSVLIYGGATLCFAVSLNPYLSLLMLSVAGAADSISVFVRQSLVQIMTPDAMRGRVSAVSSLFISASNELGEFESGVAARLFGVVGSAVFGGAGAIMVMALYAKFFPRLRDADQLAAPDR